MRRDQSLLVLTLASSIAKLAVRQPIPSQAELEEKFEQLLAAVEGITEARIREFALGALLAPDCREHIKNTIAQYDALEPAGGG